MLKINICMCASHLANYLNSTIVYLCFEDINILIKKILKKGKNDHVFVTLNTLKYMVHMIIYSAYTRSRCNFFKILFF